MTGPPVVHLTFDTELFWGLFFLPEFAGRDAEMAGVRPVLDRILALLDARDLPVTFAVVGRLFLSDGEIGDGPLHPDLHGDWPERAAAGRLEHPEAWFGRDLVDSILASPGAHEIGGHGYAHLDFDRLDAAGADRDVAATVAAAATAGVTIRSWVFPRNRVAHVDVLARHGIRTYREAPPPRSRSGRFLDQLRGRPGVGTQQRTASGLVVSPAGLPVLPGDGLRRLLTRGRRLALVRRSIEAAIRTGGTVHLWSHPHNFVRRREAMLGALEDAADAIVRARDRDGVEVLTMSAGAARFVEEAS